MKQSVNGQHGVRKKINKMFKERKDSTVIQ